MASPAPGAAPLARMITAQAALELRTLVRNGEQLLLTLIIPVLLLVGFSLEPLVKVGPGRRVDFLVPGIIALAVMSTAFTSQAIATGFERRYGVLKRLGATPLPRGGLIAAKTLTVIGVELAQTVVIIAVGLALGWQPDASPAAAAWVPCCCSWRAPPRSAGWPCCWPARCGRRPRWPPPTWSTWCCSASAGSSSR